MLTFLIFVLCFFPNLGNAKLYKCYDFKTRKVIFTNIKEAPGLKCVEVTKSFRSIRTFDEVFKVVSRRYGIESGLLKAIAKVESNFFKGARSTKGAIGIMQVMPFTGKLVGITNLYDPEKNVEAAARYLKLLFKQFRDLKLVLAAYNAGPGAVKKYRGIPPYEETQKFVKKVLFYYYLYSKY